MADLTGKSRCYRVADITIDAGTRQVTRGNVVLGLPPLSFDLLLALVEHAPNALSLDDLMDRVWPGRIVNAETVTKRAELVRESLGDDSRTPRYIGLVRGHGYRLLVPVEVVESALAEPAAKRPLRRMVLGAGIVAALFALAIGIFIRSGGQPGMGPEGEASGRERQSIAVLPLENLSGLREQEYFAAGMHEALISDLSQISALRVISRTSTLLYRDTDESLPRIAAKLGVGLVIEGSVFRVDDRVRINLQLIDAAKDAHLLSRSYERDLKDVLQLQSDVARSIARAVRITLTPQERDRLDSQREVNLETYEIYLKGMFHLNQFTREGFEKGLELVRQAIEIDPTDPLLYAQLALAYNRVGHSPGAGSSAFPRATAAALQALGLDDRLAEAHVALGESRLYFHWDWQGAEESFQEALQINNNLAVAHAHYAWLHMLHGRDERALSEARFAKALDPLSPLWVSWHGWIHLWLGNVDVGMQEQLAALELDPDFPVAHFVLGQSLALRNEHGQAIESFRRAAEISPHWAWGLGQGYALAGREQEALQIALQLERRDQPDPWALAEIYVALGDHEEALRWLETGYDIRRDWMPWIASNIFFQPLFGDPRFQEIVRRLDLPAARRQESKEL